MEFWGAEVKPGKSLKVTPEEDCLIHISQAALGESKKDQKGESVPLFAKIGDQKFVLGTLSQENFPQINFDLVFEKEFELSHNWKNGSIYVIGYKSPNVDEGDVEGFYGDSDSSDEEELPVAAAENGKAVDNAKPAKENAAKLEAKPKAKAAEPKKDVTSESEDGDESDEDDEDETDSEEEGMDVDDDDEDSEDEDEETPKKVEQSKKRANESVSKTPVPSKKAKAATPQKTDVKKGGHTATPHPAKKAGKTPAISPKSGGQFSSGPSKKPFKSNNKGKHSGK